ncbi:patatin family protein [Halanaerobium sp. ST460_2HS_T2]|uniref:patatin-like phospholipase family protein n=1 Tax=Halanaerobium sp. ST460_2HS_T2 TaxID=2183914 RepID=UPI000DF2E998|nr:patatin family protein [Halanaerobium sp. ST460_2HS_T2]RCW62004.1 putative patatin/cPLA2 family phospholipase [Halanaerobium sp. ST460_2HS_T2]
MQHKNFGLVLEGGGMRGAFTAGVIDFFLENKIYFDYTIGVSAGANNGANYTSRQSVRNKKIFTELVEDERYMSLKNLIKDGSYFGMDFLFHQLPHEILPFDYSEFKNSSTTLKVAATECSSGEIEYFKPQNYDDIDKIDNIFKASSSLPLVSNPVEIDGNLYLDGGIRDSIPVKKALSDGYQKLVVILTREKEYRKSPIKAKFLLNLFLKKYPNLVEDLKKRHQIYNNSLDLIEKKEENNQFFVFRPEKIDIDRFSRDKKELEQLYNSGYKLAEKRSGEFSEWLKNNKE